MKKLVALAVSCSMLAGMGMVSFAEETYDYENKDLWYQESDSFTWTDAKTAFVHNNMACEGFDMEAYVNTKLAEGVINNMYYFLNYTDQMDPDVVSYWESMGVKKELHDADDEKRNWASYTPLSAYEEENKDRKYPVVFVLHGNNNPIWIAETWGFAQYGAEQEYITVIPWADNGDAIVEEFGRILEELEENYPIDTSRIYVSGFSKGARSSQEVAVAYPDTVAAIAAGGQFLNGSEAEFGNYTAEQVEGLREKKMPILQYSGTFDSSKVYPMSIEGKGATVEEKITGFNQWIPAAGIDDYTLTLEDSLALANDEDIVKQKLGIDCETTEVVTLDTDYYIGSFQDDEGVTTLEFIAVEGEPHWPSQYMASFAWDFFEQFSRDTETGELITE